MKNIEFDYLNCLVSLRKSYKNIKLDFKVVKLLLKDLGNPHKYYKILHIAGTNGKGSVCSFLDFICLESGLHSAKLTSPHLNSIRERIVIRGKIISKYDFIILNKIVSKSILRLSCNPSFFDRITIIALLAFKIAKVDIVILEVGLGGRLDVTNVVDPIVCGITNIDLDHTLILGDTIKKIAREKAGIIKKYIPIVTTEQNHDALNEIRKIALKKNAPLIIINNFNLVIRGIKSGLDGCFQEKNLALAVEMLSCCNLTLKLSDIKNGAKKTKLPGRYELINNNPMILFDCAHNAAAIKILINTIYNDIRFFKKPLFVVFAMTNGHDPLFVIKNWLIASGNILPQKIIITQSSNLKSINTLELFSYFNDNKFNAEIIVKSFDAFNVASKLAINNDGYVLVTGSLYLVGEIRASYFKLPIDPI